MSGDLVATTDGDWKTVSSSLNPWNIKKATDVVDLYRFEIRTGDYGPGEEDRTPPYDRAELTQQQIGIIPFGDERWVSTQIYLDGAASTSDGLILFQVKFTADEGSPGSRNPDFQFTLTPTATRIWTCGGAYDASNVSRYNSTKLARWQWHKLVVRLIPHVSAGELQVWLNGSEIVNATGIPLGYADALGPYPQRGLYRQRPSGDETVIAYCANTEVSASSLLARVASPLNPPVVTPTP